MPLLALTVTHLTVRYNTKQLSVHKMAFNARLALFHHLFRSLFALHTTQALTLNKVGFVI